MADEKKLRALRHKMVDKQLAARGITDRRVLRVMKSVPRHQFVSPDLAHLAYRDSPLPIGDDQTISQPYMVALMSQLLRLRGDEKVLEIGTGSGYQTAILCRLSRYVYSLERAPRLAERAGRILASLGIENVDIHIGDGSQGLADMAYFDAIIVTAAAPVLPGPLCAQLSPQGGRMIIPVGQKAADQYLQIVTRRGNRLHIQRDIAVRFVPLIGRYGFKADDSSAVV